MAEGLYNDVWIESEGTRLGMFEITIGEKTNDKSGNLQGLSNGIFYITKLCHVERAMIQFKGSGIFDPVNILGYSGNQIRVGCEMSGDSAGVAYRAISGHSGNVITFLCMGQ